MTFETLTKTPTQVLIDAHKPANMSLMAWANRPEAALQSAYSIPYQVLITWAKGSAQPPITKITAAAVIIGCSERELAFALYGAESQAQAIAKRDAQRAIERNEERRAAYAASEAIRAQRANDQRRRRAANHVAKLSAGTMSFKSKVKLNLLSDDERIAHRRAVKRQCKLRELDRLHPIMIDGQRHSLRGIIHQLRIMRMQCDRLERTLEAYGRKYSKPWHVAGFPNKAKALAAGHPDAVEYMRRHWQAATHRRRAREAQAPGAGITRQQWVGVMHAWDYRCAYCGRHRSYVRDENRRMDLEIEHVVPMPHGPNDISNIVPACKPCNSSKGASDVLVWAASRGLLLDPRVVSIHAAVTAKVTHAQG